MYEFCYRYANRKFSARFLFTGTDSLVYEIGVEDVYEDFHEGKCLFDFSDYSRDLKFLITILQVFKSDSGVFCHPKQ